MVATGAAPLAFALVLIALNLRPAITSVGPLLDQARDSLDASATWAGLLTTIPVLCFAFAGLAAPALAGRTGTHAAVGIALGLVGGGLVLRILDGTLMVLGGTLIVASGIACAGVLIPVVIKVSFPASIGLTGIYTASGHHRPQRRGAQQVRQVGRGGVAASHEPVPVPAGERGHQAQPNRDPGRVTAGVGDRAQGDQPEGERERTRAATRPSTAPTAPWFPR